MAQTFTGTTISFSHRDRVWKTKYSFSPTCYSDLDNLFLSFNTSTLSAQAPHIHDGTTPKNQFYNETYQTYFSVISNYNPSSVKQFKSISIEGQNLAASDSMVVGVASNNSRLTSTDQIALIDGAIYADILFDSFGGDVSNLSFCFSYDPQTISLIDEINTERQASNSGSFEFDFGPVKQIGPYQIGGTHAVAMGYKWVHSYADYNSRVLVNFTREKAITKIIESPISAGSAALTLVGYNPVDKMLRFKFTYNGGWENLLGASGTSLVFDNEASGEHENGFIAMHMNKKTHGEPITGNYCQVSTTLINQDQEVFAINVNYEPTKLDHSLGQNV